MKLSVVCKRNWFWWLAITALLNYGLFYCAEPFPEPIRADGVGYYSYLPAIFIHGDPSFETLAKLRFDGEMPSWAGFGRSPHTNLWINAYGVGVSVMAFPFFILAHVLTYLFRSPAAWHRFHYAADGFTFFYQHSMGLGGLVYGLLGVVLLERILRKYFHRGVAIFTVCALFWGTNVFHYFSGETVMSHPYSFFLFACVLNLAHRLFTKGEPCAPGVFFLFGIALGLVGAVRLPNLIIGLPLLVYSLVRAGSVRTWVLSWKERRFSLLWMVVGFVLAFGPQVVMWHYMTGRWFVNAYREAYPGLELTRWMSPQWASVLFSLRGGVLFWSPLLVLGMVGFVPMWRSCREMFWPCIVFLVPFTYLIACWHDWAFGGGFGHRGFIEAYVFLAFPLAAFYQRVSEARQTGIKWSVAALTLVLIAYSLFFQLLYYTRELSIYGLDRQALFDILWWRKQRLESWWHLLFH